MCMLKKDGEKESCEVAKNLAAIGVRVNALEDEFKSMKGNITVGFNGVNTAVANLANEFGTRMNTLDRRIVEEKAKENERKAAERTKWHDLLRNLVKVGAYTIICGAAVAMGVNICKAIWTTF